MHDFEKLGAFYLGKLYDLENSALRDELLLYDSRDLTTHAVCVGMTGSGKTGLCLTLLEEAAIDSIPAIAVDMKGDLANLCLTFPHLAPEDFRPWVDESAAARKNITVDELAAQTADTWREGLADWGQTPERIARFREAADLTVYTPGSSAGMPLTVLRSFAAPPPAVRDDADALRDRVKSAASGLLSLLGIDADPVRSREHILISHLLEHAWRKEKDMDVAGLIHGIQAPPFDRVGIIDLETFFPSKDRLELAMSLNSLLASPSFAGWMEGEPLDIKRLLHTPEGKPRLSIISIAHLSDGERMFFLTILLSEILAWVRSQEGTSSLRALLYMDEVFGYFPPTANPPSKTPMLTLLKQARAYGLGIVLATQNPADLDYKGLSNAGTWFLGRLQTERDKLRVLEGLEGASAQAGSTFNRQRMEAILAGLGNRVFLMNNVHEDAPVVFQTRWALSYLRGPLTRRQIQTLMQPRKDALAAQAEESDEAGVAASGESATSGELAASSKPAVAPLPASPATALSVPPVIPPEVVQLYASASGDPPDGSQRVFRPALLGRARLHYVRSTWNVDCWLDEALLLPIGENLPGRLWDEGRPVDPDALDLTPETRDHGRFAPVPAEMQRAKSYTTWAGELRDSLYQSRRLVVWQCAALKEFSRPEETAGEFRVRLTQLAHEQRDEQVEKLRSRYTSKLATLHDRIKSAEAAVDREKSQANQATFGSALSFGSAILGALFGRKLVSTTNVTRMSSSMRSAGRAAQQRGDVTRAEEKVETLRQQLADLEAEIEQEVAKIEASYQVDALELEELAVRPRKGDMDVAPVALVWTPWHVDAAGIAHADFEMGKK